MSARIIEKQGVQVDHTRPVDYEIATGVWPDMTEQGRASDEWPQLQKRAMAAGVPLRAGPIWLGDNGSVTKQVIERLYGNSSFLNDLGQYACCDRVGCCLIAGSENGAKHCAMKILRSLQHPGCTIPPQADTGWIGEAGADGRRHPRQRQPALAVGRRMPPRLRGPRMLVTGR